MQLGKGLLVCLFLFYAAGVFAQVNEKRRDNLRQVESVFENGKFRAVSEESYKLPKEILIEQYAFNDTARAVINMYFDRHAHSRVFFGATLMMVTAIRVGGAEQDPINPNSNETTYKSWVYPGLGLAGATLMAGIIYSGTYDRKSLIEKLIEYEGATGLDKKTKRKLRPRHFRE